jgi:poly(A) polymerase
MSAARGVAEGDVLTHTRLALTHLGSKAFAEFFGNGDFDALLVFAVLLHDIGKPPTLKTPEKDGADRIRFDGHDDVGARMVEAIAYRLKLSSMPEGSRYHIRIDHLVWLVRNHLISLNSAEEMRSTTIEKYFYNPLLPGEHLLRLTFCDGSAAIPKVGQPDLQNLRALIDRVKKVGIMAEAKKRLPKPLIDGLVVMETLGLKQSPRVGEILRALREEQLLGNLKSAEEAVEYLKKNYR